MKGRCQGEDQHCESPVVSDSEEDDEGHEHLAVEIADGLLQAEMELDFQHPFAEDEDSKEEATNVYEVERVLGERDGRFLVRWVGWPPAQTTWEPLESFIDRTPIELFRRAQSEWSAAANMHASQQQQQPPHRRADG